MKFLFKLLSIVFIFFGFNIFTQPKNISKDYDYSILLPIHRNSYEGKGLNLVIEIPKSFCCIQENIASPMLEFVPKSEKRSNKWSELITTTVIVGKYITATDLLFAIRDGILQDKSLSAQKIVEESLEQKSEYTTITLVMTYTNKNRKELVFARYFSGPADCAGFQYTMTLSDKISQVEALKKIKEFASKNTALSSFNLPSRKSRVEDKQSAKLQKVNSK